MIYFIHRREDGSIASIHGRFRKGYAEEALDDAAPELAAFLKPPKPEDTALTLDDVERLLKGLGVTQGQINQAKKDRGR
jgi:hypothetical protein